MCKKQKGIVLLTTLIFLVLIMLALAIALSNSQFGERKVGVRYEITNATEGAQYALREAERYILAGGYTSGKPNIDKANIDACDTSNGPLDADEQQKCQTAFMTEVYEYWNSDEPEKINGIFNVKNTNCTNGGNILPVFECVNWGANYNHTTKGDQNLGSPIESKDVNLITDFIPKYIITYSVNEDNSSIKFDVTGLGYGQNSGILSNTTNVLLNATYILSK